MKKLIIALFLLFSINANSQVEKYYSYTQYHTQGNYTEMFNDTCKIIIEVTDILHLVVISGKDFIDFIPLYDFRYKFSDLSEVKSLKYNLNKKDLKNIEFIYQNSKLSMIIITRPDIISNFIIFN